MGYLVNRITRRGQDTENIAQIVLIAMFSFINIVFEGEDKAITSMHVEVCCCTFEVSRLKTLSSVCRVISAARARTAQLM